MPKRGQSYKEIKIPAKFVETVGRQSFHKSHSFFELDTMGTASPIHESGGTMKVGYQNAEYGSDKYSYIYRGLVYIDISPIKEMENRYRFALISAKLYLHLNQTGRSAGGEAWNAGSAATYLYVLDGPWRTNPEDPFGFGTPAHLSTTLSQDQGRDMYIDITNIFISWFTGETPNNGLMFVGDHEDSADDNHMFWSEYSNIAANVVCLGYFT